MPSGNSSARNVQLSSTPSAILTTFSDARFASAARDLGRQHRLERALVRLGRAGHPHRAQQVALGVTERQGRAADLAVSDRALDHAPLGRRRVALLDRLRPFHRRHDPVERDRDRDRALGDHQRVAQRDLVRLAFLFPPRRQRLRQAIEARLRRIHVADPLEQLLRLLRCHLHDHPERRLRRLAGPEPVDDAEPQLHRAHRPGVVVVAVAVQPPLHRHLARRGHVRLVGRRPGRCAVLQFDPGRFFGGITMKICLAVTQGKIAIVQRWPVLRCGTWSSMGDGPPPW